MKLNECDKQNRDVEKHTNGTDVAEKFPPKVLVSNDVPKCSLCKITFDSFKDFENHSLSLEHVQKVIDQDSFITLSSHNSSTSTSCLNKSESICVNEIDNDEPQEKSHSSTKTCNLLPENKELKSQGLIYSCHYCIKEFSGPIPYKQHLESNFHKKKAALENNSFAEIKNVGHLFCDICKKEFSGEKPYNEHLISKKHKRNEQYFKLFEQNNDDNSAPKTKKIKLSNIDKQFFCEICKIPCSGPIPYASHLAGSAHEKNVSRFQARINIGGTNGSDLACSENMKHSLETEPDDESAPTSKKAKIELIPEKEKQWFCEICKKLCSGPVPYSQHLAGNDHKRNVARFQVGVNTEPSINQLYPFPPNKQISIATKNVSDLVCSDKKVDNNSTLDITEAEREENKMDERKPAWFCQVCNVHSTGPLDFSNHLGGKNHTKKLNMYNNENYCNNSKDYIYFDGTKSNSNGSMENSFCYQEQNVVSGIIDYEGELKKSLKIYSLDDEINFD